MDVDLFSSLSTVTVRIKERDHESSAKALGAVWDVLKPKVKRRFIHRRDAEQLMAHVTAAPGFTELLESRQSVLSREKPGGWAQALVGAAESSPKPSASASG